MHLKSFKIYLSFLETLQIVNTHLLFLIKRKKCARDCNRFSLNRFQLFDRISKHVRSSRNDFRRRWFTTAYITQDNIDNVFKRILPLSERSRWFRFIKSISLLSNRQRTNEFHRHYLLGFLFSFVSLFLLRRVCFSRSNVLDKAVLRTRQSIYSALGFLMEFRRTLIEFHPALLSRSGVNARTSPAMARIRLWRKRDARTRFVALSLLQRNSRKKKKCTRTLLLHYFY